MIAKYITAIGIVLNACGAFCFAYEAIKTFGQATFQVDGITYDGHGEATKTPAFIKYDQKRIRAMWIGLIVTVAGYVLQFIALFMDIH